MDGRAGASPLTWAEAGTLGGSPLDLVVGIVSWNTASHLDACLTALPAALGDLAAHVVVVDNASSDDSVAVAARHGVDVIENDTNRGYAVAMNQALASATAPYLLALNPDTVPAPGTIAALVDHARAHPNAGVVVPRLTGEDGRQQYSVYRFPAPLPSVAAAVSNQRMRHSRIGRRLYLEDSGPYRGGVIDWAIGAVHLIRHAALDGEAPYSERSFMYAEDLDLCWRLAQRGAPTVLASEVTIMHVGNVAGAQAWGSTRSARYWAATYDVISQCRSPIRARWVGLWCAIAAMLAMARTVAVHVAHPSPMTRPMLQVRAKELAVHARTALAGPPPPPTSPPAET